jgi:3-hydroxyisobutyrate dehydrogenase-like beta-hydroxyacid dehydrogenase
MNVGFIGLGAMGLPMAKRVLGGGHKLYTTFHRRREPAQELGAMGAEVLKSPGEVAQAADAIITILPADLELKETVFGETGILNRFANGKVLIEMTSGTALAMREVDDAIRSKGGSVLDAPVSGGTPAAEQGTLTIMVGGDEALLERCRPLLQTMGTRIVRVGKVGQGKVVKIVNQMMAALHLLTIGEAFALGINSGADPATLYEVIKTSSGYSKMMDLRLPGFLLEGSFKPGFKLDLMKKDVSLALESAKASNTPLLLTSVVAQVLAAVSVAGKGGEDFSVAAQFVAALAGVNLSEFKTKSA